MEETQEKQNFQIYPAKQMIVPNDRTSKKLFNLTLADLQDWIAQQDTVNLVEILRHKKFGKVLSPMKLTVDDETFTISEPLDQFHCAVLCAGISELYSSRANGKDTSVIELLGESPLLFSAQLKNNQLLTILLPI